MSRDDVQQKKETCRRLYAGDETPHRSCGIALAETFGQPTAPYQALRKGGITGCGECGAIVAGRLILGQVYGDPDPTGGVTDELVAAMTEYERLWRERIDRGDASGDSVVCNVLTGQFERFRSRARHDFCTNLAADAAECVALAMESVEHPDEDPASDGDDED